MITIVPSLTQSHISYRARDGTDAQVWGRGRTQMILSRAPDNISTQPQRVDDSNRMWKEETKKERKKEARKLKCCLLLLMLMLVNSMMLVCSDEFGLKLTCLGGWVGGWSGGCGWPNWGMDLCYVSWDCSRERCVWAPRGPACSLALVLDAAAIATPLLSAIKGKFRRLRHLHHP